MALPDSGPYGLDPYGNVGEQGWHPGPPLLGGRGSYAFGDPYGDGEFTLPASPLMEGRGAHAHGDPYGDGGFDLPPTLPDGGYGLDPTTGPYGSLWLPTDPPLMGMVIVAQDPQTLWVTFDDVPPPEVGILARWQFSPYYPYPVTLTPQSVTYPFQGNPRMAMLKVTGMTSIFYLGTVYTDAGALIAGFLGLGGMALDTIWTRRGPLVKDWGDDTPATVQDVHVYVGRNRTEVEVAEVNPYIGRIKTAIPIPRLPVGDPDALVIVDYRWTPAPIMAFAGLGTEGLVLGKFDRTGKIGMGRGSNRFPMAVVLGGQRRPEPKLIGHRYLGVARSDSALLGSPETFVLGTNPRTFAKRGFERVPPAQVQAFDAQAAPDPALWQLHGTDTGHANTGAETDLGPKGSYTVVQPAGDSAALYSAPLDAAFPHAFTAIARFEITDCTPFGVCTGAVFGGQDAHHLAAAAALLINGVKHFGLLLQPMIRDQRAAWEIGPKATGRVQPSTVIGQPASTVLFSSASIPPALKAGRDRFQILDGPQAGVYALTQVVRHTNGTTVLSVSPGFPVDPQGYGRRDVVTYFEVDWGTPHVGPTGYRPTTYRLEVVQEAQPSAPGTILTPSTVQFVTAALPALMPGQDSLEILSGPNKGLYALTALVRSGDLTTLTISPTLPSLIPSRMSVRFNQSPSRARLWLSGQITGGQSTLIAESTSLPGPGTQELLPLGTGCSFWGSLDGAVTSTWSFFRDSVQPDPTFFASQSVSTALDMSVLPEEASDWAIQGQNGVVSLAPHDLTLEGIGDVFDRPLAYGKPEFFLRPDTYLDFRSTFKVTAGQGVGDASYTALNRERQIALATLLYVESGGVRSLVQGSLPAGVKRTLGVARFPLGDSRLDGIDGWEIPRIDATQAPNSDATQALVQEMDWTDWTDARLLYNPLWGVSVYRPDLSPPPYYSGPVTPGFLGTTTDPSAAWINIETPDLPLHPALFGYLAWGCLTPQMVNVTHWQQVTTRIYRSSANDQRSSRGMVLGRANAVTSGEADRDWTPETATVTTLDRTRLSLRPTNMNASRIFQIVDGATVFRANQFAFDPGAQMAVLLEDAEGNPREFSGENAPVQVTFAAGKPVTETYLLSQPLSRGVTNLNEDTPPVPRGRGGNSTSSLYGGRDDGQPKMKFMEIPDGGQTGLIHIFDEGKLGDFQIKLSGTLFSQEMPLFALPFEQRAARPGRFFHASGGPQLGFPADADGKTVGAVPYPLGGVVGPDPDMAIIWPTGQGQASPEVAFWLRVQNTEAMPLFEEQLTVIGPVLPPP